MKTMQKTLLITALLAAPFAAAQAHDDPAAHQAWLERQKIDVQPTLEITETEIPADSAGTSSPGTYRQPGAAMPATGAGTGTMNSSGTGGGPMNSGGTGSGTMNSGGMNSGGMGTGTGGMNSGGMGTGTGGMNSGGMGTGMGTSGGSSGQ